MMKIGQLGIAILCIFAMLLSGCALRQHQAAPTVPPADPHVRPNQVPQNRFQSLNQAADHPQAANQDARIPVTTIDGKRYFPLQELLRLAGYRTSAGQTSQQLLIGDIDPSYVITVGSKRATKEGQQLTLSAAPIMKNNQLLAPVTVLSDLFERDIRYRMEPNAIVVQALSDRVNSLDDNDTMLFAQSQSQSQTDSRTSSGENAFFLDAQGGSEDGMTALSERVDADELIDAAKHYMGTPYQFGAAPYPKSHQFDCSSFTQYIYGKFGIELKRVARRQADQGKPVSRQSLRKGDLVFFSVPGRFKSDNIVGHVGIYIGDGKMINTYSDKKGVHIADINRGYWSTQYLEARRVII